MTSARRSDRRPAASAAAIALERALRDHPGPMTSTTSSSRCLHRNDRGASRGGPSPQPHAPRSVGRLAAQRYQRSNTWDTSPANRPEQDRRPRPSRSLSGEAPAEVSSAAVGTTFAVPASTTLHVLCDIAYSRSPAASRASAWLGEIADPDGLAAAISDQLCDLVGEVQPGCLSRASPFLPGRARIPRGHECRRTEP